MEIILALVVASAVIFFGALISMGNERQRKAIDGLREQVVLWAVQDLKIKREHLARTVDVPDPLDWLCNITGQLLGYKVDLTLIENGEHPNTLMFVSTNRDERYIFTTHSPAELNAMLKKKRSRISKDIISNPLHSLPPHTQPYEFSNLNCGLFFDLELDMVWKKITNTGTGGSDRLWLYILS